MPTLSAKLVVHIEPEVLDALKALAKERGQTLGTLVRRSLLKEQSPSPVIETRQSPVLFARPEAK
jgi:hypothetical protein